MRFVNLKDKRGGPALTLKWFFATIVIIVIMTMYLILIGILVNPLTNDKYFVKDNTISFETYGFGSMESLRELFILLNSEIEYEGEQILIKDAIRENVFILMDYREFKGDSEGTKLFSLLDESLYSNPCREFIFVLSRDLYKYSKVEMRLKYNLWEKDRFIKSEDYAAAIGNIDIVPPSDNRKEILAKTISMLIHDPTTDEYVTKNEIIELEFYSRYIC